MSGLALAREEDAVRVEPGALNPAENRRILLHQLARQLLGLGVEHDETEWPVPAATGEPHATLGIPRLKPRRVLLNNASLLLACLGEETPVKRGPDNNANSTP